MGTDEIIVKYKTAKNKEEMITILAELTNSDEETIIEVLKDAGIEAGLTRKCYRCGCEFLTVQKMGRAYCPSCRELNRAEKKHRENQRARIKRNLAKIQELQKENERIKRALADK